MRKTQEKKGITLISLVITIIVLLILAAVAITLAVDSDGLFTKAGDAANKWNTSVGSEQTTLQNLLDMADEIALPNYVSEYVKQGTRTAPIPNGFVVSGITTGANPENLIEEGLVIYETGDTPITADFWTAVDDEGNLVCQTNYNQYVWIPVDNINDMVMCQIHGAEATLDTKTLQCPTCKEGTKLAGKLYIDYENLGTGSDMNSSGFATDDFDENATGQTYSADTGYREPAVVTGSDGASYDASSENYHGLGTASAFLTQLQNEFNAMAKSVAKYGGFYIGRYEMGEGATTKKIEYNGSTGMGGLGLTAGDVSNAWYGLYEAAKKTGTSTVSQMIWGSQYDQAIKFIGAEAQEWGHTAVHGCFVYGLDLKNIYGLREGNGEWTAEAADNNQRIVRGGNNQEIQCQFAHAASERGSHYGESTPLEADILSTRTALYIK